MKEVARNNPQDWFLSIKTVDDTRDNEGNRIVTQKMIEEERRDWMDEDLIQQEYYCSFDAAIKWAYYADQLKQVRIEWRIWNVPYEPNIEVNTFWDLWFNDTTVIWFAQIYWKEVRLIDHYEMSGESLEHYVWILKSKPYKYGFHYFPHDIEVHELQTGNSRKQYIESLGIRNIRTVPKMWVMEWIDASRRMFKHCWFDEKKCDRGINALSSYHKDFDDKNNTYRNTPKHDWSSNSADAFRYLWVTYKNLTDKVEFESIEVDFSSYI
jgi:hypothetical protein